MMKRATTGRRSIHAWGIIVTALGGCGVIAALYLFDPATTRLFPPCVWKSATGWDCPGCGSTRAVHQLLHGDAAAAFRLNPMFVVGLPLLAATWAWGRYAAPPRSPAAFRRRRRRQAVLLLIAGLTFCVWRNVIAPSTAMERIPAMSSNTTEALHN